VKQHLIARPGAQPLSDLAKAVQLEKHESQGLAVALAELDGILQLAHQGGMVEQPGQAVTVHQLADSAAPSRAGDDGLHQEQRVSAECHEVIRPRAKGGQPLGRVLLAHEDDRQQLIPGILSDHARQGERIRVHRPGAQQQQVG
jgi:hypothetical protein